RARFELKQRGARIAILFVLLHRVAPGLPRPRILQLACRHRNAVDCKEHINGASVMRMTWKLSRQRQRVFLVQFQYVVIETVRWFEISEPKCLSVKLEPVPQHMKRALEIEFLDQRVDEQRLESRAVQCLHFVPEL